MNIFKTLEDKTKSVFNVLSGKEISGKQLENLGNFIFKCNMASNHVYDIPSNDKMFNGSLNRDTDLI